MFEEITCFFQNESIFYKSRYHTTDGHDLSRQIVPDLTVCGKLYSVVYHPSCLDAQATKHRMKKVRNWCKQRNPSRLAVSHCGKSHTQSRHLVFWSDLFYVAVIKWTGLFRNMTRPMGTLWSNTLLIMVFSLSIYRWTDIFICRFKMTFYHNKVSLFSQKYFVAWTKGWWCKYTWTWVLGSVLNLLVDINWFYDFYQAWKITKQWQNQSISTNKLKLTIHITSNLCSCFPQTLHPIPIREILIEVNG